MESGIRIESRWTVDAPPQLALSLIRRLDIVDKLSGELWRMTRNEDGSMTARLSRGAVHIITEEAGQTDGASVFRYRFVAKRYGITMTASAEVECHLGHEAAENAVTTRFWFDDSRVLRLLPRVVVERGLSRISRMLWHSYNLALEALSSDWDAALAKLEEADQRLIADCGARRSDRAHT
jgi:hypothetical protein